MEFDRDNLQFDDMSVKLRNITSCMTEEEIEEKMTEFGTVTKVKIPQ